MFAEIKKRNIPTDKLIWVRLRCFYFSFPAVAEAFERLLMQRFVREIQDQIPKVLRNSAAESNLSVSAEIEDTRKTIYSKHEEFRE